MRKDLWGIAVACFMRFAAGWKQQSIKFHLELNPSCLLLSWTLFYLSWTFSCFEKNKFHPSGKNIDLMLYYHDSRLHVAFYFTRHHNLCITSSLTCQPYQQIEFSFRKSGTFMTQSVNFYIFQTKYDFYCLLQQKFSPNDSNFFVANKKLFQFKASWLCDLSGWCKLALFFMMWINGR